MEGFRDRFLESLRDMGQLFDPNINTFYSRASIVYSQTQFCGDVLKRIHEIEFLKREKFDLVIGNQIDYCDVGLAHYFEPRAFAWLVTGPLHENNNYALGKIRLTVLKNTIYLFRGARNAKLFANARGH